MQMRKLQNVRLAISETSVNKNSKGVGQLAKGKSEMQWNGSLNEKRLIDVKMQQKLRFACSNFINFD